jgi:prepilin-type N-terminal cleavage/methylation domain-containing protein/prepilin-type processing-associated H-X9-DG protein
MLNKPLKSSRNGFTLIELLVVISIIALLIALLLPALKAARATAQQSVCLQRERQIAVGMAAYRADNNGMFISNLDAGVPATSKPGWFVGLIYYMGTANNENVALTGKQRAQDWHYCPVKGVMPDGYPPSPDNESDWLAYNQHLGWTHNNPGTAVLKQFEYVYEHQVTKPSETMMIADGWVRTPGYAAWQTGHYFRNLSYTQAARANIAKHQESANYVFVDGHGESIRADDLPLDQLVTEKYPILLPFKP